MRALKNLKAEIPDMKPEMEVVKIQQQCQILAGSNIGVNDTLIDEEVEEGFAPFFNDLEL